MTGQAFYSNAYELLARRDAGASWDELAEQTGWQNSSLQTIISKARRGRIPAPSPRARSHWSEQMDATLKVYWPVENSRELAHRLSPLAGKQLTPGSVNARANRLGLAKPGTRTSWRRDR